jgi:hypothetical protein
MPIFELALLLAAMGVAAFPCWPHSAGWSYWPSASAGVLLLFIAIVAAGGNPVVDGRTKASSKASMTADAAAAPLSTSGRDLPARQAP